MIRPSTKAFKEIRGGTAKWYSGIVKNDAEVLWTCEHKHPFKSWALQCASKEWISRQREGRTFLP